MDDYPPQVELHRKNMEQVVSPVCSNVHFIRIAKFMKQISMAFGYEENLPELCAQTRASSLTGGMPVW